MKPTKVLLWLAIVCLPAAGCESLGGGLDIVNETGQTLYFYDKAIQPNGGRFRFETSNCSDSGLAVRTKDGTVVAELTERWCPDQTWTITGTDDSSLTDK